MTDVVQAGERVLLHLSVLLDDGSIADSTKALGKPALLQLGDGSLSNAMEQQLVGLGAGDNKKFRLSADDSFGESNVELIQFMNRYQFSESLDLEEGKLIQFDQANGEPMVGIIREIQGDSVKVDFNHPLAGEAITFEIEVIKVNPATKLEAGQGNII